MANGELLKRVAVAAVGIPLAVIVIYAGGWILALALAMVASGAAIELFELGRRAGALPFVGGGAVAAGALVLIPAATGLPMAARSALWSAAVGLLLLLVVLAVWLRGVEGRPLTSVAVTFFGAIFCGGTLAHAVLLRHLPLALVPGMAWRGGTLTAPAGAMGLALVAFPMGLTWLNDTFAYFAGKRWGRRKLIPSVSPAKTVVGAVAGALGTTLVGALYGTFILRGAFGLPVGAVGGAVGGLVISVAAQLGDLAESVMKREAGVKDSGALLPGHGGLLDRFDALFVTIPIAYWYLASLLLAVGGRG